jgi:hypothetical protein
MITDEDPDLHVAGLELWVPWRRWHFLPGPGEDWSVVTAECSGAGAAARMTGPIVSSTDFRAFLESAAAFLVGDVSEAKFEPREPNLNFTLRWTDAVGHLDLLVNVTPDHLTQSHHFRFDLDQTYVDPLRRACERILARYTASVARGG